MGRHVGEDNYYVFQKWARWVRRGSREMLERGNRQRKISVDGALQRNKKYKIGFF